MKRMTAPSPIYNAIMRKKHSVKPGERTAKMRKPQVKKRGGGFYNQK